MADEKRHLLIFFKTGGVVKIEDFPEGFDFPMMCRTVRLEGYFQSGLLYFPHDVINGMAWVKSESEVQFAPNDGQRTTLQ